MPDVENSAELYLLKLQKAVAKNEVEVEEDVVKEKTTKNDANIENERVNNEVEVEEDLVKKQIVKHKKTTKSDANIENEKVN